MRRDVAVMWGVISVVGFGLLAVVGFGQRAEPRILFAITAVAAALSTTMVALRAGRPRPGWLLDVALVAPGCALAALVEVILRAPGGLFAITVVPTFGAFAVARALTHPAGQPHAQDAASGQDASRT